MLDSASEFARLMQRVADGDEVAVTKLFHLYNPILLAQLRKRLNKIRCLRSLFDADDLAQNIWLRFFAGSPHWRQFPTPDHLLHYFARTGRNHIRKLVRDHLRVQKRDVQRCHSLSERHAGAAAAVVADSSPTPAWMTQVQEDRERRLSSLKEKHQGMARMIEAGFRHSEIAAELGCSERTIRRVTEELRRALRPLEEH
jgi:RNA polymerase sigma factor (sigma-70 family)